MMKNTISIGKVGEYYAAAKLEMLGFTVALPPANTERFDLIAINRKTKKVFEIQVKSTTKKKNEWQLSAKNENIIDDDLYYIFVKIFENKQEYYVVDSKIVANYLKESHKKYMDTPGKNGPHKNNTIRKFLDIECKYLEKWDELLR